MITRSSKKARPQLVISPPKETWVGYKIVSRVNRFDEKEGVVLKSVLGVVLKAAEDTGSGNEIISFGFVCLMRRNLVFWQSTKIH